MDEQVEEGLTHLQHIEEQLVEIKERTPNSWKSFVYGVMQGAGAIVGSIVALILLGWMLSIFGVIPGVGVIAHYVQNVIAQIHR